MAWRFSNRAVIQTITAVFIVQSIDIIFNWLCRWTTLNNQSNVMIARNTILPVLFTVNMNRLKLQGNSLKIQYSLFRLYCVWNGRLIISKKSVTIMLNGAWCLVSSYSYKSSKDARRNSTAKQRVKNYQKCITSTCYFNNCCSSGALPGFIIIVVVAAQILLPTVGKLSCFIAKSLWSELQRK